MSQTMPKRSYTRRTEEQRIQELEAKLAEIKAKIESKKDKDSPLHREWTKAHRALVKFIQVATDNARADLALSTEAFAAGIQRSIHIAPEEKEPRRRGRPGTFSDAP